MITEKEMNELKGLVDATFINCNTPQAEHKIDVLQCMTDVFSMLKPKDKR